MLASVHSYRVMVKSVSSCCAHGRQVLSNPVTLMYIHMYICVYVVMQVCLQLVCIFGDILLGKLFVI